MFSDDAYYYAIVARNFAETGRFTFDGLSPTSGFHPLLFWLEVAGYALCGTKAAPLAQYVAISVAVGLVFVATVAAGLVAATRPSESPQQAAVRYALVITLCVVLAPRFAVVYLGGMEAILVLPLLLLVGSLVWQRRYASAGLIASLLVMARLDTLPYVVLPLGLACAWRERRHVWPALGSGAAVVSPAMIAAAAYTLWHWWCFGHPLPIHGALKSCLPRIHLQWQQLFANSTSAQNLLLVVVAALVGGVLALRRGKVEQDVRWAGATAAAIALIQLAVFLLFQKWSKAVPVWYFTSVVLAGAFALAVGMANVVGLRGLQRLATVAGVAALAVNSLLLARVGSRGLEGAPVVLAGAAADRPEAVFDFMRAQPRDQIWACTDCGKLAFWSDRQVVNLDGLVNDFQYQDALRDQQLGKYLVSKGVRYLVFLAWDRPQTNGRPYEPMYEHRVAPAVFSGDYETADYFVYSYRYLTYSDRIRLPRSAEVWRSTAERDGRAQGRIVVFDLDIALRGAAKIAADGVTARTGPSLAMAPHSSDFRDRN